MQSDFDEFLRDEDTFERPTPSLEETVESLKQSEGQLPEPDILYGLSDLTEAQYAQIKPVWDSFDATYQHIFMQMLVDAVDANFELDYTVFAMANLDNPNPDVRKAAIEVMSENDSLSLMYRLMAMVQRDPSEMVRAEAMNSLARFVLMSELGDLPEDAANHVQHQAASILNSPDESPLLRARALEALANCGHKQVTKAIQDAYHSADTPMRYSAVVAMGRSCDERWNDIVLQELETGDADMRRVAARAAGELQINEAVPLLAPLLNDPARDTQEAAIWSMGEIGGREAIRLLNILSEIAEDQNNERLMILIEEALGNASLSDGGMMMLDIDLDDLD